MPNFSDILNRADMEVLVPPEQSREIQQRPEEMSSFLTLARRLPNMATDKNELKVLDSLPVAYFVDGDNGLIQTTKMKWKGVYVYAEKIACIVPISDNCLSDSNYDIWGEAVPKIREAIGLVVDVAAYTGANKPDRWPQAIIPGAIAAGNNVSLAAFSGSGAMALFDATLGENGLVAKLEADGFMPNGHVAVTSMKSKYRSVKDENKQPVFHRVMQDKTRFELDGEPILFPKTKPFSASDALQISGDFSEAVWSMRSDMKYQLFDSGSLQDIAGNTVLNLLQQDQIAMRVIIRLGWALPNPVNRENENNSTRYPFGVLQS